MALETQIFTSWMSDVLGSSLLAAIAIVILSILLGRLAYVFIRSIGEALTRKTKTKLDDRIVKMIELPVFLIIVASGFYLALGIMDLMQPYLGELGEAYKASLMIIGIYVVLRFGSIVLDWYSDEIAPGTRLQIVDILPTLKNIWGVTVAAIGGLMLLENFGIAVSPLIASLGIAGLAVALALQDTLSNFFAGIYISADRPVRKGDYIMLESKEEGYVERVGWRNSEIRMLSNNLVIIPNSKLSQIIITNYSRPSKDMAVVIQMSVSYESDLKRVEKVVVDEAAEIQRAVPGAIKDFEPFIRYHTFADSGVEFSVILRVQEFVDKYLVTHEFFKAVHARFEKEGIEIPYPKRSVYIERMPKHGGRTKPKA